MLGISEVLVYVRLANEINKIGEKIPEKVPSNIFNSVIHLPPVCRECL